MIRILKVEFYSFVYTYIYVPNELELWNSVFGFDSNLISSDVHLFVWLSLFSTLMFTNICWLFFLCKGIEPGRVLIVLAGRHRGKRVVFLKQLPSGLLLVNGPFTVNQCPLRRMHQQYVIVTSTKLDISSVKVPAHIDDRYFKARREKKTKKADGSEVFAQEKKQWKPDAQRKTDQKEVDTQLLDVIRKQPEKKLLFSYLGSYFQLRNRMYPHKLKY